MSDGSAEEILKSCTVEVAPGIYTLVSLDEASWNRVLSDPSLSPSMAAPFMILKDRWEVTMLLDEKDFSRISEAVQGAKTHRNLRMISFDVVLDFNVVGFMAAVSGILADAGIPILAVSSFGRDHLLIGQDHLASALKVLGGHVDSLC